MLPNPKQAECGGQAEWSELYKRFNKVDFCIFTKSLVIAQLLPLTTHRRIQQVSSQSDTHK